MPVHPVATRSERLLLALYAVLVTFALPVFLLHLLTGARRHTGYLRRVPERFGLPPRPIRNSEQECDQGRCLWIHAVSVGEVQAAMPLVLSLKHRYPARPILLTTTTPAGADAVARTLGDQVLHSYLPWDLPGATARFLDRVQPAAALILETELWPNLFRACRRRNIPLLLVNARRSARSTRHYQWVRPLVRHALNQTDRILAQGPNDARRFLSLGASASRVRVNGNIKFDYQVPGQLVEQGRALGQELGGRPVWIAACTHAGEESLLLEVHQRLRRRYPDLLLVLVPRHPERCEAVAALCAGLALPTVRRQGGQRIRGDTAVLLGDAMGELPLLYAMSDIAFIGGSLVTAGGHNPIEAGAQGVALLIGPHTGKLDDTLQLFLDADAILRIRHAEDLGCKLLELLGQPALRRRQGDNARSLIKACSGGTDRTVAALTALLPT